MEDVYSTVLESIANVMASEVQEGKIGVVSTVDDKYYLVQWTCLPYHMDSDSILTEYDPPIHIKNGELVCKGEYLESLNRAKGWYYKTELQTVVQLQQVLAADVKLSRIKAPNNLLPRAGWPQREPPFDKQGKKPERLRQLQQAEESRKICDTNHGEILEEMRRRQLLDYEEEEETDGDGEEQGESDNDTSKSDDDTSESEEE